jgi:hypothetical protein
MVDANPLREHLWALLITALYQTGRQAEALRAANEVRARLGEELGVEPGRELRDLEQSVIDHDPALDPPRPARRDVRGRRRRTKTVLVSALGLAVIAAVAFGSWRWLGDDGDGPRVVLRHLVPGGARAAVAGGGSIWVMVPDSSQLVSVNPQTGGTSEVELVHRPSAISAGLGSIWVASEEAGRLLRINARSGQVEAESPQVDLRGASVAVGADAVWVIREDVLSFLRIDPVTLTPSSLEFTSNIPPVLPSLAVDSGPLWATNSDLGTVLWLDPMTGESDLVGEARLANHAARSITGLPRGGLVQPADERIHHPAGGGVGRGDRRRRRR